MSTGEASYDYSSLLSVLVINVLFVKYPQFIITATIIIIEISSTLEPSSTSLLQMIQHALIMVNTLLVSLSKIERFMLYSTLLLLNLVLSTKILMLLCFNIIFFARKNKSSLQNFIDSTRSFGKLQVSDYLQQTSSECTTCTSSEPSSPLSIGSPKLNSTRLISILQVPQPDRVLVTSDLDLEIPPLTDSDGMGDQRASSDSESPENSVVQRRNRSLQRNGSYKIMPLSKSKLKSFSSRLLNELPDDSFSEAGQPGQGIILRRAKTSLGCNGPVVRPRSMVGRKKPSPERLRYKGYSYVRVDEETGVKYRKVQRANTYR